MKLKLQPNKYYRLNTLDNKTFIVRTNHDNIPKIQWLFARTVDNQPFQEINKPEWFSNNYTTTQLQVDHMWNTYLDMMNEILWELMM